MLFWVPTTGNHNFKKYSHGEGDYYGEGYDFDSVMHYGNWAFSTNNKMTIQAKSDPKKMLGQRDGFSPIDVKQLNKVYQCKGYENVKVPPPKGTISQKYIHTRTVIERYKYFGVYFWDGYFRNRHFISICEH